MVRIPNIKIPSVRVESIVPTSNIGTGGATPVPPTPITYLTQWKMLGNSQVHTDPYLTSWKVSGNSVVDNNTILSCGDLGQDGKYHVKISNGVDVFDIALTEPLRKVGDVADTIEFPSDTEGKALVTRPLKSINLYDYINSISRKSTYKTPTDSIYAYQITTLSDVLPPPTNDTPINGLCSAYIVGTRNDTYRPYKTCIAVSDVKICYIYDSDFDGADDINAFKAYITEVKPELIYELATPTTELVDAPQISVSSTDTYTSANVVPYSAFEHTENKEIWSCGEYNATDGKYHILVQPQGGSIADIALDEPLRKVNDVADTIEFPSSVEGKALVTRNFASVDMGSLTWDMTEISSSGYFRIRTQGIRTTAKGAANTQSGNILCALYETKASERAYYKDTCIGVDVNGVVIGYDPNYNQSDSAAAFKTAMDGVELIYELKTPTTELVDAPQIQEAESYSCVISQGGKAVEWSSFETESNSD